MWTSSSTTSGSSSTTQVTASSTRRGVAEHVDEAVELGAHAGAEQRVVVDDHDAVVIELHHQLDLGARAGRAVDRGPAAVAFHASDYRVADAAAVGR